MRIRKSADQRREEIVAAALALIDQAGPGAATTTAIAQAIGVSQAAVFRHFPRKDDILLAVIEWIANQVGPRMRTAAEIAGPPLVKLRNALDTLLGVVRDTPAMPAILFSRELHNENAVLRAALYEKIGRLHDLLAGILTAGAAIGQFRRDLDVDRAAFMIIGLLQGLVVRWSLSGRRLDLMTEGHTMLDLLLNGLLARPESPS